MPIKKNKDKPPHVKERSVLICGELINLGYKVTTYIWVVVKAVSELT